MNHTLAYAVLFSILYCTIIACNDDDIPDPYQPAELPKINRLDFISGNDSSIFIFDANMVLISGRGNNEPNSRGYEWYTMQYADRERKQLSGATYNIALQQDGHRNEQKATCSRNNRNMLSDVVREDWTGKDKSYSLLYDDRYRLSQVTLNLDKAINRYTISYDGQSNVTSVELYKKTSDAEGTTKTEYSGYNTGKMNPFRYLVNVFYAPVFSSENGTVIFGNIPLGMLLSVNSPAIATGYEKKGDDWVQNGSPISYSYDYGDSDSVYPIGIGSGGLSLDVVIR